LLVFGSILRGDFRSDSDVDFLVDFETCDQVENYDLFDEIRMREELSCIVGRKVDIINLSVIEATPNRFIKASILSTAKEVHARR
jgi:predicted nucleotidyltransferase